MTEPQNSDGARLCDACAASGASACPHLTRAFSEPATDPLLGKTIGERYQVEEFIGSGGFGRVYRVIHTGLKTEMALKMLHSSLVLETDKLERFKQEAEAVSKLDHPNICRVTDFAEGPEHQPCMIMELLKGDRLDTLIKVRGPMSRAQVLELGKQVCSALKSAHDRGIVHRDLKPSNIILVDDLSAPLKIKAKVLDFGLAKVMEAEGQESKSLTQTGGVVGTPNYMSPEQCLGKRVDRRTDVYAIGCILYEAVTGRKAFDGNSPLEIMNAHLQKTPAPFNRSDFEDSDHSFEAALLKAMETDADHRYQSVDELLADLQKLESNQKVVIVKKRHFQKKLLRKPVLIAFTVLTGLLAVLLAISTLLPQTSPRLNLTDNVDDLSPVRPDTVNGKTLDDLNKAIEANPKDPDAFYQRGRFHAARDERDNAIEDYTKAISLDPHFYMAYPARSEMYVMVTRIDKALADANKAIELMPRWYWGYGQRARVEGHMQDYHRAIADAQKAINLNPNCSFAFQTLELAYGALGQHQKALDCVSSDVLTGDPKNVDDNYWNHWDRGQVYLRARELASAASEFRAALACHGKAAQSWGDLATALAGQDKLNEALPCIKRTMKLDSFPARALRLKGEMYRAAGKWKEAVQEYSSSTSLEPWYGPGYEQRAVAEISLGQLHSAELDLQKALQLQPFAATTNSLLALVEDQLGKSTESKNHLQRAFALLADLPMNFVNRAYIEEHAGNFRKAVEDCNQAINLDNRLSDAYCCRSIALEKLGKTLEAADDRSTASRLHWHNPDCPLKVGTAAPAGTTTQIAIVKPQIQLLKEGQPVLIPPEKLPPERRWALAAGAIFSDAFYVDHFDNMLEITYFFPDNIQWAKGYLAESGVTDARSTIQFVDNLAAGAENSQPFRLLAQKLASMTPDQIDGFRQSLQSRKRELYRLDFTLKQYKQFGKKEILSFDLIRCITFCRIGFLAGYLSESQSWERIMKAAEKLQSTFDSWQDLSQNYLAGREFYYGCLPEDQDAFNQRIQRKLFKDPTRPCAQLPFKLPLDTKQKL
jgi:serine/threonine protein kinase